MPVYDPQAFGQALKQLAEGDDTPYAHISRARHHMEDAELHALAFGLINLMVIKGEYDDSRTFLKDNLVTGSDNMQKVLQGLNRIAANFQNVEQANILVPRDFQMPDVRADNTNVDNYVEGAALYFCKIGLLAMLTQGVSAASAKLAITAGVAVLLWLGYMPDDAAISKAHTNWDKAAEELGEFDANLITITGAFARAWRDDKGQEAFQTWITNFGNEVDECKVAVETGAKSMGSLETTLATQQHTWFLVAVANLIVLAAMEIAGWAFPPSKPAWKVAMEIVGAIFSITTGGWMAYAASTVKALVTTLAPLALTTFVTEKKGTGDDLDENGVDFNEVKLSDEAINTLYTEATA
jgi:hypothetical protein